MSQPLPNGTHLNPKFSGAYINPNFQSEKPSQIHINPNFKGKTGEKNEQSQQILVNPNFANATVFKRLIFSHLQQNYKGFMAL